MTTSTLFQLFSMGRGALHLSSSRRNCYRLLMELRGFIGRLAVMIWVCAGLAGCMAAPPPPSPPPVAPASMDLLHSKVDAYNAGLEAGKRQQARRDAVALAAARLGCAPGMPNPVAPPEGPPATGEPDLPSAKPATTPPPATAPAPAPNQGQVYTPGGPAIPVSPVQ